MGLFCRRCHRDLSGSDKRRRPSVSFVPQPEATCRRLRSWPGRAAENSEANSHVELSRRDLLRSAAGLLVLSTAAACKGKASPSLCTDLSALQPADTAVRTALGYVEPSTEPGKDCAGCVQFTAAPSDAGACGSCKLMKGPIHPKGYCRASLPRRAKHCHV